MAKSYSPEFITQILKEIEEVGSYRLVADKHQISHSTVYGWHKGKTKKQNRQPMIGKERFFEAEAKALRKQLSDKELENNILRDLLKKTYQVFPTEKK